MLSEYLNQIMLRISRLSEISGAKEIGDSKYTKISRITEVDSAAKFRMSEFLYVQRARQSEFNYVKDIHNVSMQQY